MATPSPLPTPAAVPSTVNPVIPPFSKFSADKEKWSLYADRLEFYFIASRITAVAEKKLFSCMVR